VRPLDESEIYAAASGRIHHYYIDLEQTEIQNARKFIKALGQEIQRMRALGECVGDSKEAAK
jgi:hypothetical protein